jgi:hypothetical protein
MAPDDIDTVRISPEKLVNEFTVNGRRRFGGDHRRRAHRACPPGAQLQRLRRHLPVVVKIKLGSITPQFKGQACSSSDDAAHTATLKAEGATPAAAAMRRRRLRRRPRACRRRVDLSSPRTRHITARSPSSVAASRRRLQEADGPSSPATSTRCSTPSPTAPTATRPPETVRRVTSATPRRHRSVLGRRCGGDTPRVADPQPNRRRCKIDSPATSWSICRDGRPGDPGWRLCRRSVAVVVHPKPTPVLAVGGSDGRRRRRPGHCSCSAARRRDLF